MSDLLFGSELISGGFWTWNRLRGTETLWETRLWQVDPMEGISLIGLPLLELLEEPVDVLVFELATELDDRSDRGIPCEGGGGGARWN